jgi:hypothetical protein
MSFIFDVSQTPANYSACVFQLKQLMKTAGWLAKSSSDGTTFNSSGDQISTGVSGAGGFNNSGAWERLQDPAGIREVVLQRSTSGSLAWWIKYSALAKFTGGSASVAPTATDGQNVVGTSAAGTTLFTGVEGSLRCHCFADNAAPYTFGMVCYSNGGSTTRAFLVMDGLQTGSFNVLDQDPIVFLWANSGVNIFASASNNYPLILSNNAAGAQGVWGWIKFNIAGATWQSLACLEVEDNGLPVIPGGFPTSSYSGNDEIFPISVGRISSRVAPNGYKGVLKTLRWLGPQRALSGDTLSVLSTRDYLVVESAVAVPFNGTVPVN